TFELLAAPGRVSVPAVAAGAVPVELTRLEPAVPADIARQAPGLRANQLLGELDLGPFGAFHEGGPHRQQLLEPEQRRCRAQRLLSPDPRCLVAIAPGTGGRERGETVDRG